MEGLVGLDLEKRQIALGIGADDIGRIVRPIGGGYGDLLGVLDDMVVGDRITVGADDEARAFGYAAMLLLGKLIAELRELVEKIAEGAVGRKVRHVRLRVLLRAVFTPVILVVCDIGEINPDADHRRHHLCGKVGKACGGSNARRVTLRRPGALGAVDYPPACPNSSLASCWRF